MKGTIEATSQTGIKVDGEWKNYGKFFKAPAELRKGQEVEFESNQRGYLTSLSVIGDNGRPAGDTRRVDIARSVVVNNIFGNLAYEQLKHLEENPEALTQMLSLAQKIEQHLLEDR